jgi:hypothetical protein
MKRNLETLIEAGIEQGAIDYVAGLFRVFSQPHEVKAADNFRDGLKKLEAKLDHAHKIVNAHLQDAAMPD